MKYAKLIISILLVCTVIISSLFISKQIANSTDKLNKELKNVNSQLKQYMQKSNETNGDDILSLYEAAAYLKINDYEDLLKMVESGVLQDTYYHLPNDTYYFVKEKLYQWCLAQTE